MARIRSVKPEFCTSEAIAVLSERAELHFIKLWTYADDFGRGVDNPKLLKAALWPLRDEVTVAVVVELQDELERAGRIVRYEGNGKRLFAVTNWHEHQKPQHPKGSIYDAPPERGRETAPSSGVESHPLPPATEHPHEADRKPHEGSPKKAPVVVVGVVEGEGEGVVLPAVPARRSDPLWDAVMEACGIDQAEITSTARGGYNVAVKALRDIGAAPSEVHRRAAILREKWDVPLTPTSLAKNWAKAARAEPKPVQHAKGQDAVSRALARRSG